MVLTWLLIFNNLEGQLAGWLNVYKNTTSNFYIDGGVCMVILMSYLDHAWIAADLLQKEGIECEQTG